ncbi:hypothetical protein OYE22_13690 [Streptomyces sp. 71268]|uniref:DUF7144 family membrane protein n=1 Tax=Streptomyces sp. 71268 TaxID=3002640 RepID=UPI0023F72037|nr:hypothetical protein [Streptomyces sp. 71268]WEV26135.1 hypothetical protein OYE22_13690 [Streptomyces sp. 71268]
MSDHPSPVHRSASGRPDDRPGSSPPPANSAWATGGAILAAVLLLVNGVLLVLQGIAAIAEDDVYVRHDSYLYRINLTGWGWTLLALGALLLATGCGILTGRLWARATAITLAALSLVAQFLFLPYAPVWSVVVMALDLFVIWALAVYQGDRVG